MIDLKGNLNDKWNKPLTFALYLGCLDYKMKKNIKIRAIRMLIRVKEFKLN